MYWGAVGADPSPLLLNSVGDLLDDSSARNIEVHISFKGLETTQPQLHSEKYRSYNADVQNESVNLCSAIFL